DATLFVGGEFAPRLIAQIGGAGGEDGAAMVALQDAAFAQIVEVLADRLRGDVEAIGQPLNADPALGLGERDDVALARAQQVHAWPPVSDLGHLVRLRRLRKLSAFVASDKAARQ